jgi:hypothetical protein
MARYVVTRDCHVGIGRCDKCIGQAGKIRVVQMDTDNKEQAERTQKNWDREGYHANLAVIEEGEHEV